MGRYESPDYEVLLSEGNFELRRYASFYVVEYDNEEDPSIEDGFSTLFNFIGSENREHKKISMTVPVIEEVERNRKKMAFVLPKKHWDDAPLPKSEHLRIRSFEAGRYASVQYTGRSNAEIEKKQIDSLQEWISARHWKVASNFMLAFYNPPITPGLMRRNEILVLLEDD